MSVSQEPDPGREMTLTVLGCGAMGIAILSGILASLSDNYDTAASSEDDLPAKVPTKFIACVRSPRSAQRIQDAVSIYTKYPVQVLQNDNINGVNQAEVIILGCEPYMLKEVLEVPGMKEALKGKLLISILAGISAEQIEKVIDPDSSSSAKDKCRVVRAIPNVAASVRESMTVIGTTSTPALPEERTKLVTWIFSQIGRVAHLSPAGMDVSGVLAGSGPAFMALALEGITDGAVAMGLSRADAQLMAAQVMRGTAALVLNGEHPAQIREKVSTPGGCTIGGLMVLEEKAVRGNLARSIREATVVASQLGQGAKNLNGPRY